MLLRETQVDFRQRTCAWHSSDIPELKDALIRVLIPTALQKGSFQKMKLTITSSVESQDIFVGLLCLFLGTTTSYTRLSSIMLSLLDS